MKVTNKKANTIGKSSVGKNYDGFIDSGAVELNLTHLKAQVKTMPESKEKKNLWTAIENLYHRTFEAVAVGFNPITSPGPIEA